MAYPLRCYKDGWEQGEPIIIYIPNRLTQLIRGGNYWENILNIFDDDILAKREVFDCTYIVGTQSQIDNVVNHLSGRYLYIPPEYNSANNAFNLYFAENKKISLFHISSDLSYLSIYYPGVYTTVGGTYQYQTFRSTNEHSQTYGITIENLRTVGIETDYYYGSVVTYGNIDHYRIDFDEDPYQLGGASSGGGGTGTFSDVGENIGIPALPTLSAVDTGFITLFNPSLAELKSLAAYMWAGLFDISTFKKIFADPMDCILGLSIVPVAVPSGAAAEVKVGNIGTGINITTASAQYVELDCGTLNVQEFWGAYLDYDPYTKFEIYLPYIGTHPINADDIMGKTIQVVYHVDILSGACNAYLKCGGTVLYTFIGQCASSIPITGNDWTNVINGVLSIAGAIGTMVATGGATAPMAAGTIASTAVNGFKSNVEKSGSMSGTGGMLAIQKPYLICTRPRQARPAHQNTYLGYPSFITSLVSELSGYTEIEEIHLENIPATANEKTELETLLKGGVIL